MADDPAALADDPLLQRLGGIAGIDRPRLQCPEGDAPRAEQGAFTDRHVRADEGFRRDPRLRLDHDRTAEKLEIGIADFVRASAQVPPPLGHQRIGADGDAIYDVTIYPPAQARKLSNLEIARIPDANARIDAGSPYDLGAEQHEQKPSPAMKGWRRPVG